MITQVHIKEKVRQDPPASCNAFGHVALVTYLTRNLQEMLQYNKQLVAEVRAEMNQMKINIQHSQQEILKIAQPYLQSLWATLQAKTQQQKQQNIHLQDQINDLKKQKMILSQMIVLTDKMGKALKQKVGY